jgi:hypothetical protein
MIVVLLGSAVLFVRSNGKPDKQTWRYIAIMAVVALVNGAMMWGLYAKADLPILYVFLLALSIGLLAGYFHIEGISGLKWAERDTYNSARDSFLKEAGFTYGLSALVALLSLTLFGFLTSKWDVAASMWGLILAFALPFTIVKAYDFLMQIPDKEFDKKWFYEIFPFDETSWKRENMISVGFVVADSIRNEKRWFRTKARFSIVIPRDQELRLIYRLALREYHKKEPSVPVQELGYEEDAQPFWWLFSVKFVWWKPSTWLRQPRYLDPTETIANNNLQNGDFIAAKRMFAE